VHELYFRDNGEPVTAPRLRAVRLGAIEVMANLPGERDAIHERYDLPLVGPLGSADFFKVFPSRPISAAELRALQTPPLTPPTGRGYPDEFYANVASTYRAALRRQERPVVAIAESAGVPRSTAGRWVKEARRRGLLGEAQPGKAGDFAGTTDQKEA
jgi:hypothetical protein